MRRIILFRNFLTGRYGNDQLNFFIMILSLVCGVMTFFTYGIADAVLSLLQLLLLVIWVLRAFSRNHYNRGAENQKFLRFWFSVKKAFKGIPAFFKRLADRKHKYFRCERCKSRLRVPRGRGNITVTCPRCKHKFDKKS